MQLPQLTQRIIDALEAFDGEGESITINAMPMQGKQVSRYYNEAVEFIQKQKGPAYDAWANNEVKFIVNQTR